ncbi:MAG: hypothetical protein H6797_00240 [Candidatus Nomurabacteria bacterium]|nr:MAG: hypothetical protein H6797_00240 [Candidatus Nomurabacteria bacterium]
MKVWNARSIVLYLSVAMALFTIALLPKLVSADALSWTNNSPVVESVKDASSDWKWRDLCQAKYNTAAATTIDVVGTGGQPTPKTNCVMGEDENYQLFSYNNFHGLAVKFVGDKASHAINGITCTYSCIYMPSRDVLAVVSHTTYIGAGQIDIYKNFVSKLKLQGGENVLNNHFYAVGQTQPDQTISNDAGSGAPGFLGVAKHMQHSPNDKWLVVEFVGLGLVRIDMDTMQMVKFSDWKTNYTIGYSPTIEFNITNDGQHVAVLGQNTLNSIYDISGSCGNVLPDNAIYADLVKLQDTPCPVVEVVHGPDIGNGVIDRPNAMYQPKFSEDSGEISFYATSYDSAIVPKYVTLRAANYIGPQPLDYLALGDSYSSGEGDTTKKTDGTKYYLPGTDVASDYANGVPEEKCHISSRSYPFLLRTLSGIADDKMRSVACSGAVGSDIYGWSSSFDDNGHFLGQYEDGKPRLAGLPNIKQLQDQARSNFTPGRIQQIEFIERNKPKATTLSIGGNDVLFGEIIRSCVTKIGLDSICEWAQSNQSDPGAPGLKRLGEMIGGEYSALQNLYMQLKNASPETKIYVLGYPQFIDSSSSHCPTNFGLNQTERQMITEGVAYMNQVIKAAANAAGVYYVDIENSLGGHVLCGSEASYVNGTATGVIGMIAPNIYEQQEAYHPDADGHLAVFKTIGSGLNGQTLTSFGNCNQIIICPASNQATQPPIPSYFRISPTIDTIIIKAINFVVSAGKSIGDGITSIVKSQVLNIHSPSRYFAAGSNVSVNIYSNQVNLGTLVANENGSIDASITVPSGLEAGYHTIIFTGTTYSGDPIEYTQIVLVQGSNPDDIDDDGIIDSKDPCLFVTASGVDGDMDGIDDACDPVLGDTPPATPVTTPTPAPTTPSPTPTPSSAPTPSPKPSHHGHGKSSILSFVKFIHSLIVSFVKLVLSVARHALFRF